MSYLAQFASLLCAGTMMVTSSLQTIAPQRDIDGSIFLVNRTYRISEDYVPQVVQADVSGSLRSMRPEAAAALEEMFAACQGRGGRDPGHRQRLPQLSKAKEHLQQQAQERGRQRRKGGRIRGPARRQRASAGHGPGRGPAQLQRGITSSFADTKGGAWIAENCWRFGFILRYQEGWEDITGYSYEPWHVRYVGLEHAQAMHEANVPMETYMEDLR